MAVLLFVLSAPCKAANAQQTDARNSIARVVHIVGENAFASSAFYVGSDGDGALYFVTVSVNTASPSQILIMHDTIFTSEGLGEHAVAHLVYTNKEFGFSILKVNKADMSFSERFSPLSLASGRDAVEGQSITLAGFVGIESDAAGASLSSDVQFVNTQIAFVDNDDYGYNGFLIQDNIDVGFLGGPVLDEYGNCIGMTGLGQNAQQQTAVLVVYGETLTQCLQEEGIPFSSSSGNSIPLWVIIAAAAVVLLVVGAVVLSKKKPAPAAAAPSSPYAAAPTPFAGVQQPVSIPLAPPVSPIPSPVEMNAPLEKSLPTSPMPEIPFGNGEASPSVSAIPYVIGIKGLYLGNSIPVKDSVQIGRNSSQCQLVYPKQAPGISALHCELKNVGGNLQLIDRGSAYGTFLGNGTRLLPNVPHTLQIGDVFYLATPNEAFQVTTENLH